MLVPLFLAAALLDQAAASAPPQANAGAKTSLSFTINIAPIPSFGTDTLHLSPSRRLIPLKVTLDLDGPAEIAREQGDLVAAINRERTSRGLGLLAVDPLLDEAACAHSREMCRLNYFNHRSPTPGEATPIDRYLDALHTEREPQPANALVGENIFFASETNDIYNAEYAHKSLMASPGHRKNILEPRFTKIGVGVYRDPEGQFWVTEMFLRDS